MSSEKLVIDLGLPKSEIYYESIGGYDYEPEIQKGTPLVLTIGPDETPRDFSERLLAEVKGRINQTLGITS